MTILESSDLLLRWFSKNNYFNYESDFKELMPNYVSDTPEADEASLKLALQALEENKAIKSLVINKKTYYILVRPFETMEQNISIGYNTILTLTDVAKQASERLDNQEILIDPLNITERDILIVINILLEAAKNNKNN